MRKRNVTKTYILGIVAGAVYYPAYGRSPR
jgi:hypothetical protein